MFLPTLTNVLITLCYIAPGFVLCKCKKNFADHLPTIANFLIYVCSPCLMIGSLWQLKMTKNVAINMSLFFVITFALQLLFILITFLLLRKKFAEGKYRLFTVASVMGNVGFFGMPIVKALFPGNVEVMSYSCVASLALNILAFTVCIFCVTGKRSDVKIVKGLFNPTSIGFIVGIILCLVDARTFLPAPLVGAVELLGNMCTPICMLILGIRLATVSFTKLFTRPMVYVTCIAKLVAFPLFCYLAVYFLPVDYALKASILVLCSVPCASMVLNVAEIFKSETEYSANCVLLSTLLCFLTIPLLTLLL